MNIHVARTGALLAMLSLAAGVYATENDSKQGLDLGLRITEEASAADAGLPAYPGSKPYKDPDQSNSAANVGISTPLFGLKVVAMNLQTSDQPEKVATFYRRALSKYGTVLDCSKGAGQKKSSNEDDEELECDADDPGEHRFVYKVGTESNQRLVAIKPHDGGTRFSLVHVNKRGKSK